MTCSLILSIAVAILTTTVSAGNVGDPSQTSLQCAQIASTNFLTCVNTSAENLSSCRTPALSELYICPHNPKSHAIPDVGDPGQSLEVCVNLAFQKLSNCAYKSNYDYEYKTDIYRLIRIKAI